MKPIKGFKEYTISSNGVLVSHKRKTAKKLKPSLDKYGYFCVKIVNDSGEIKNKKVHRIVAETYLAPPNISEQWQVNHKDGVKTNNTSSNLEWATHIENSFHADELLLTIPKLKRKHVKAYTLDGTFIESYVSTQEASKYTGIPQSKVSQCCRGIYKEYNGIVFRFLEDSYYKFPVTLTKYHKTRV